jgi:hypothetical protein
MTIPAHCTFWLAHLGSNNVILNSTAPQHASADLGLFPYMSAKEVVMIT